MVILFPNHMWSLQELRWKLQNVHSLWKSIFRNIIFIALYIQMILVADVNTEKIYIYNPKSSWRQSFTMWNGDFLKHTNFQIW